MLTQSILSFFTTLLFAKQVTSGATNCNEAYSCFRELEIEEGDNGRISCGGYYSCSEAAIIADGNVGTQFIQCTASFSCHNAQVLLAGGVTTMSGNRGEISCDGFQSCSNTELQSQDSIFCEGSYSCINSKFSYDLYHYTKYALLTRNNTNAIAELTQVSVYCDGNHGCAGSSLYSIRSIYGSGAYSLYSSRIYTNNSDLNITLSGYGSGFALNIFCNYDDNHNGNIGDDKCYVNCKGNSCMETYLHCNIVPGAGRITGFYTNCNYNCGQYDVCPYICIESQCVLGSNNNDNSNEYKNTWISTNYERYWNKTLWELDFIQYAASFSVYANNLEFSNCGNGSTTYHDEATKPILCDNFGQQSTDADAEDEDDGCFANEEGIINLNGSICCRGYSSCAYGSGLSSSARIKKNGNNYGKSDVLCDGSNSCGEQTIYNSNGHVYCNGVGSCALTEIYGNSKDESIDNADNYHVSTARLYCDAALACYSSKIDTFDHIECNGMDSCYSSNITNVPNVYANGANSLKNARIYTTGDHNSNSILVSYETAFAGTNSEIICGHNGQCKVYCKTIDSCYNVTVHCKESCDINCDEDSGIQCPTVFENSTKALNIASTTPSPITDSETTTFETTLKSIKNYTNINKDEADETKSSKTEYFEETIEVVAIVILGAIILILVGYIVCWQRNKRKNVASWQGVASNEDGDDNDNNKENNDDDDNNNEINEKAKLNKIEDNDNEENDSDVQISDNHDVGADDEQGRLKVAVQDSEDEDDESLGKNEKNNVVRNGI